MIKYIYIYQTTNTNDNMSISNDLHTTLIIIANSRGHCNNTIFNSCFEQDLFLNIKWETRTYLYRLENTKIANCTWSVLLECCWSIFNLLDEQLWRAAGEQWLQCKTTPEWRSRDQCNLQRLVPGMQYHATHFRDIWVKNFTDVDGYEQRARNKSWLPRATALHRTAYIVPFFKVFTTHTLIFICFAAQLDGQWRWADGQYVGLRARLSSKFWNISISRQRHTSLLRHLSEPISVTTAMENHMPPQIITLNISEQIQICWIFQCGALSGVRYPGEHNILC